MLHLLRIEEIKHLDSDGTILWKQEGINNIFHKDGQQFVLSVAFATGAGITIPTNYYLGLDNRTTPSLTDILSSLSAEPTQNGYLRQAVSSANGFSVSVSNDGNYRATSSVATFSASGGAWGPVRNLFLTTSSTSTGYLISSAQLDTPRTVLDGQTLTMRISVGLVNC